jgi:cytochrome c5
MIRVALAWTGPSIVECRRAPCHSKAHAGAPLHGQGAPWGADGRCLGPPDLAEEAGRGLRESSLWGAEEPDR